MTIDEYIYKEKRYLSIGRGGIIILRRLLVLDVLNMYGLNGSDFDIIDM
jgi:hypothetical protein